MAPARVSEVSARLLDLGVYEIAISDTIGIAHPGQVPDVIGEVTRRVPLSHIALHFHDTRGTALVNVFAGLQLASQRALWGDDRGALAVLQPLAGAVTEWLETNPDDDIADDLHYVDLFMQNLRARGAEEPAPQQNPPEPWPSD